LGWTLERYKRSTFYEFNEASKGYWRKYEREVWQTREIVWTLICGNPNIKSEDKPKQKDQIYKLGIDEEVKKEKKKPPKVTPEDLNIYQQLGFNAK